MTCNHNLSISTTGALKSTDIQSLIDAANPADVIHINQYLAFNEAWTNDTYNIWKVKSDVVLDSTWFDTVKSTLSPLTFNDYVSVFHIKPTASGSYAHYDTVDNPDGSLKLVNFGLNFVVNSNSSKMVFFDKPDDTSNVDMPISYFNVPHSDLTEVERVEIPSGNLMLVNIGKYHDIVDVTADRWAISLRATNDMTWDQVTTALASWIV